MTCTVTRVELRKLATTTTDPMRAGETMLEAAKQSIKMTKRETALDLVKGLRQRKIGTNEVENVKRNEGVVIKLMDIVVNASKKKVVEARRNAFRSKLEARRVLPAGWRRNTFEQILSSEMRKVWRDKKEKNARKKDHLEAKYKPRKEKPSHNDIPVSDERLDEEFGEEEENVEVFGYCVEVNEDEKEFLRLPKSATDYVKVNEEDVNTSIQVMAAKLRMSIKEKEENRRVLEGKGGPTQGMDVQNDNRGGPARGLDGESEDDVLTSKRVFDVEKGTIDFKKKKVTEMVTNKWITVPEAAENQKEAKIQVLVNNLEDMLRKSMKEEARCLKAGNPVISTMTVNALRGKASLLEREKAGELVLVCSDKSGRLYPMSKSCMEPHIAGDSVHTRADITKAEKEFNGASRQTFSSLEKTASRRDGLCLPAEWKTMKLQA